MPEGHTIHRLARDHNRWLAGHVLRASSPQGKFTEARGLDGRELKFAEAWGKHLFHHWKGGAIVHIHLGLFGRFQAHRGEAPEPRPSVRLRLQGPERCYDLIGATTCERLTPAKKKLILERLGPDPLREDSDPDQAWALLQKRRISIGQALMDQSVVAGVGNVYRAEILAAFGLHPLLPSNAIDQNTWHAMWARLQEWMRLGVSSGKIITTDPERVGRPRSRMRYKERVNVYGRQRCGLCKATVQHQMLAGRRAWVCTRCQPAP